MVVMKRTPSLALIVLGIIGASTVVYLRILSAGFVAFDDDIHVYANPFLNPPTLRGVATLWQQSYERLYVPLAYTIFAPIARFAQVQQHVDHSTGYAVGLDPIPFHLVSVAFHMANTLLCFFLARRLTRRMAAALLCSLVFALHPLQTESVSWISELRGLAASFFALMALNSLGWSRHARDSSSGLSCVLLVASVPLVTCSMLCKPAAVVLPIVALAIDRTVLGSSWRRAVTIASIWAACTVPFAWITRSLQATISPAGESLWWQRPFIAGDALTFYLFKIFVPVDLCVDYGRTPRLVLSTWWGYLTWVIPVGLLSVCYRIRHRRPITWLGALMFVAFLLPTLGLVPFTYQAYSTVADRYAYLALLGFGLVVADAVDYLRPKKIALGAISVALVVLAALSLNQSRYWMSSPALLRHTIDVNPNAAFAYHNLGNREMANGAYTAAVADYQACLKHDPTLLKTYLYLAEAYSMLGRPEMAVATIAQSMRTPGITPDGMTADDFSKLGLIFTKMKLHNKAAHAFSSAAAMAPTSPAYLCNAASALSAAGQLDEAEQAFRSCISMTPSFAGAHTGLGVVLAEKRRLTEALDELRAAVRVAPNDSAALDNLKRVESLNRSGTATGWFAVTASHKGQIVTHRFC